MKSELPTKISSVSPPMTAAAPAAVETHAKAPAATEALPPQPSTLVSGELVLEIDRASGRFVSKIVEGDNAEDVLRQYPKERELIFSAALRAYVNALRAVRSGK
ncbi:MAG: hypothetical protein AB7O04_02030 [Hyphomonadaceae bacterium]